MKTILLQILYAFAIFLTPIKELLILMFLAILIDTFFALYKTWKLHGKDEIKSHKLFNLVTKTFFYLCSVIGMYMMDTHIFGPLFGVTFFLAKAMTLIFLFIEIKSIDETSTSMGNKSLWDIITDLCKKIGGVKKDITEIQK